MNRVIIIENESTYDDTLSNKNILDLDNDIKNHDLDLIKNDSRYKISTLLVRKKCIIIVIDEIKCIILNDKIIFFSIEQELADIIKKISSKTKETIGFSVLDKILSYITSKYNDKVNITINDTINLLENTQYKKSLKEVVKQQNFLIRFKIKVTELKEILDELIDNNEDLQSINNSINSDNPKEIEIILETYENYIQNILNNIEGILKEIEINQNLYSIDLAINRNLLAQMTAKISIVSLGISSGTFISSTFGMNLNNHIEDDNYAFVVMTILSFIISFLIIFFFYYKNIVIIK